MSINVAVHGSFRESGAEVGGKNNTGDNNFDLIRFCLAMTVCLAHARTLSGGHGLDAIDWFLNSEIAVQGFFAVSGFLVFMSYDRSSSLLSYFEKRVRRLVPAYVVVIFLSAVLLGAVSTASPFYFTRDWWAYLGANLSYLNFLHPELPGVFQDNPVRAVNGALWTLKVEIAFYLTVPVFAWAIRRIGAFPVIAATYALSAIYASSTSGSLAVQLPGQLRYFMVGAACYYFLPALQRWKWQLSASAAIVFIAGKFVPLGFVMPAAVGLLVMCAGLFCYLGDFGAKGDFSYGVYILHFPILQLLVQAGAFEVSPWGAVLLAVLLTVAGAVLMWTFVERRFLHRHRTVARDAQRA